MLDTDEAEHLLRGAPDAPFWEALAKDELRVPRCAACAAWVWPARPACPTCTSTTFDWTEVTPEGTVYSWTRVWYPFVAVRVDELPYVVLVVELPHAGRVRILGTLHGDEAGLAIGAPVNGIVAAPSAATYGLPALQWLLAEAGG